MRGVSRLNYYESLPWERSIGPGSFHRQMLAMAISALKTSLRLSLGLLLLFSLATSVSAWPQNVTDIKPSPQQIEWQDLTS